MTWPDRLLVTVALIGAVQGTISAADPASVAAVLDDWHAAAAEADATRYFGHFAADGVFMGTDATERWTVAAFRDWARPYFERGRAWSFRAVERSVVLAGEVAWFDETLETPNLGPCRGTGVLVDQRAPGAAHPAWKIAHYNLSVPIPNDLVRDVVGMIAGELAAPSARPLDLTVMSFNIRNGSAEDGDNSWPGRRDLVAAAIRARGPDVVGLQEALEPQLVALDEDLGRMARVGVGRDDGRSAGEHVAIYYDTERFERVDDGTFWFSATPEVPGSTSFGNRLPRICTWVELQDRRDGRSFHVFNVHLDHRSAPSRAASVTQLLERIEAVAGAGPVVVTGDFNAAEDSSEIERMRTVLLDTYRSVFPAERGLATFHGWSGRHGGHRVDYVFVPLSARVLGAAIERDPGAGRWPSDHYPVTARVRIP